jgi:hypothetical protein
VDCGLKTIPAAASTILEQPVVMDELLTAYGKGKQKMQPEVTAYAGIF